MTVKMFPITTVSKEVQNSQGIESNVFLLMFDHPGSPGTSVVNLTCTTNTMVNSHKHSRPYQVSLHCAWLVGKDAPEDTQYFLYYRLVPVLTYANGLFPPP